MKTKYLLLTLFFLTLTSSIWAQCKDSIYVPFTNSLPTQGGTWASNSIVFGDSIRCGGTSNSCALSKPNYAEFNGIGDFIRTPLITQNATFSFWYRRSSNNTGHRVIVETSPDNSNWTTQLQITTIGTTFRQATINVNNVFVRIRDQRDSTTSTRLWYLDDIKWVWEANVGVWTGGVSSDWNNPSNWCKGQLPTSLDNVLIPTGTPFPCVLSSGIASCKNLNVPIGSTLNILGGTLRIAGTITSTSNIFARNATIELNGTTSQIIKGSNLSSMLIGNLIISNPTDVSFGSDPTDTLKLLNSLTFTTTNTTLNTGNLLYLCSSDTITARIGVVGSNRILGDVVVERFIPNHPKAWQLLSVPVIGYSINSCWQEGNVPLGNNKPGYGTTITSNLSNPTSLGFDLFSPGGPSMKSYNPITNQYDGVTNTSNLINTNKGYFLFVRGDRSVTVFNQPATSTTLRTKGKLYTPIDNPTPIINVGADKYECINNFYTSAIDFSKLKRTGGIQNTYYLWDPKLTSSGVSAYGLGGYQTFVWNGAGYTAVPGGGSYSLGNTSIESGSAFFVRSVDSIGTLEFIEDAKTTGSNSTFRTVPVNSIQTNLSAIVNGQQFLLDGVISFYDRYSNQVDNIDVRKLSSGEGIGILRNGINLTAEYRTTNFRTDTVFFNLTNLRRQFYQLDIKFQNSYVNCKLVDNFLNTETPILGDSEIAFEVTTNPLSQGPNRFYLVLSSKKKFSNNNIKKEIGVFVSPNPLKGNNLYLTLLSEPGRYRLNIFNIFGKSIYSENLLQFNNPQTHIINLNLKFGFYSIVVENMENEFKSVNLLVN